MSSKKVKVENTHSASVEGIPPGSAGEVEEYVFSCLKIYLEEVPTTSKKSSKQNKKDKDLETLGI